MKPTHGCLPSRYVSLLWWRSFGTSLHSRALEAMAFALFAYGTMQGEPNNVPSATGAKRPVVMGKIVPGKNGLVVP